MIEDCQLQPNLCKVQKAMEVSLDVCEDIVIIRDPTSKKYGGLLGQKVARCIIGLEAKHGAKLSATVKPGKKLEVLIYGLRERGDAVADWLFDSDCYLQQPDAYDSSMTYHNPQLLVQPGKTLEPTWETSEAALVEVKALNHAERSMVAELLDSATGPTVFRRIQTSDIVVTELKM